MGDRLLRALVALRGTLLWGAACLALLPGCAAAPPRPELLRRHATLERADAPGRVTVTVFAAPETAGGEEARLLRLSKSGQSELIEAVAAKTSTVEAFLDALAAPVSGRPAPVASIDRTRFRRRVVISAELRHPGEADRIAELRVVLALDTLGARFTGWDRYASEHGTVEVGEAAFRRESEADLDLRQAGTGAVLNRTRLRLGNSAAYDEELAISDRYLSTGVLLPDSLVLLQRGALGLDLTGNSVAVVEIEARALPPTDVHRVAGLFDDEGRARPAGEARVVALLLRAPRPLPSGIVARVGFDATVRVVPAGAGDATFTESDDHARLVRSPGDGPAVTLVPAGELRVSVWELADVSCRTLHLRRPGSDRPTTLHLLDWDEADRLARWLAITGAGTLAGHELFLGPSEPLSPTAARALRVRLRPLNWDPGPGSGCP